MCQLYTNVNLKVAQHEAQDKMGKMGLNITLSTETKKQTQLVNGNDVLYRLKLKKQKL